MIKITQVITGLHVGGAETMLYRLLATLDKQVVTSEVISLLSGGEYTQEIRSLAIPVHDLGMRRGTPSPTALWRLRRLLDSSTPVVVQTWMYHADLLGALATRGMKRTKLVWNIRHSNLDRELNSPLLLWTVRLCAWLSHLAPAAIICNSSAARQIHVDWGYDDTKFVVIPNGFDTESFRPNAAARAKLRIALGILPSTLLIGVVGRFHEQKDHATFIQAAGLLHQTHPEVHFVLCGAGVDEQNTVLARWLSEAGVATVTHLLGQRSDIPDIMPAFDLLCSSSAGEGFPNAVGEAMSCGVPCVVTDVGDSAVLVGDTGFVVPLRQPAALAARLAQALNLSPDERSHLGNQARQRIISNFGIQPIAARYMDIYLSLANP